MSATAALGERAVFLFRPALHGGRKGAKARKRM
jgi:hypothetical protein